MANQLSFISNNSTDVETKKQEASIEKKPVIKKNKVVLQFYIDGAARNNPGPAGAGVYIIKNDMPYAKKAYFLESKTNNQAEYLALLLALYHMHELKQNMTIDRIVFYSDSKLLVQQMMGIYRVKNICLQRYVSTARILLKQCNYTFKHILRHANGIADGLANDGIDNKVSLPAEFIKIMQKYGITLSE